jgi:hypothetical protein
MSATERIAQISPAILLGTLVFVPQIISQYPALDRES